MTMGSGYQNRVFVNLADGNMVSQPANTWDIAFIGTQTMHSDQKSMMLKILRYSPHQPT